MALAGCLLAWTGIGIQLYDTLLTRQLSLADTLIKFFSYFTILTNLLVAIFFTTVFLVPQTPLGRFLNRYGSITAITVYILVVGIVYNISLRSIWTFTGWARLSNELVHVVTPLYCFLFWLLITVKERLSFSAVRYWMIYPLIYLIYTIIRGSIVHSYPYPFVNVNNLGYPKVLFNSCIVAVVFFMLFNIFIAIGNRLADRKKMLTKNN